MTALSLEPFVPPVLSLCGVAKSYVAGLGACRAAVRALDAVDLDVHAGELVEVVGARGAGKSTLLLCAAGLVAPDRGSVAWAGTPLAAPDVLASGYAVHLAAVAPWDLGVPGERVRLALLDDCVGVMAGGRMALDGWLAHLGERGIAALVAGRAPRLACTGRVVVMARGRIVRDVSLARGAAARVAERGVADAHGPARLD